MEEAVKSRTNPERRPAPPLVDATERVRRRRTAIALGAVLIAILIASMTYGIGRLSSSASAVATRPS